MNQIVTARAAVDSATLTRRLTSVDALRGIVMILMALDHVRDFFGVPGVSPTNLAQTTVPLFLTRWITHICAPTFFLLTGTGAFLSLGRKSIPELSRFLFVRGVWLIVLELTVIRCFGFQFNVDYQVTHARRDLGARLGDDRARRARVAAGAGHSHLRRRDDRGPQPPGRHTVSQPDLGDAALAGFRREPSGVRGLRPLHADSLGWRDRGRVRVRPDLSMESGAPARISPSGPALA